MRISDWSSDVCSSDLRLQPGEIGFGHAAAQADLRRASLLQRLQQATDLRQVKPVMLDTCHGGWRTEAAQGCDIKGPAFGDAGITDQGRDVATAGDEGEFRPWRRHPTAAGRYRASRHCG